MKMTTDEIRKDIASLEDVRRLVTDGYHSSRRIAAQHGQGLVIDNIVDPLLTALDRAIDRLRAEVRHAS